MKKFFTLQNIGLIMAALAFVSLCLSFLAPAPKTFKTSGLPYKDDGQYIEIKPTTN